MASHTATQHSYNSGTLPSRYDGHCMRKSLINVLCHLVIPSFSQSQIGQTDISKTGRCYCAAVPALPSCCQKGLS